MSAETSAAFIRALALRDAAKTAPRNPHEMDAWHEPSNMGQRLEALNRAYFRVACTSVPEFQDHWICIVQEKEGGPSRSFAGYSPDAAVRDAWTWHQGHADED